MKRVTFPWYDSIWLGQYVAARRWIAENQPAKLEAFTKAMVPLRTSPEFRTQRVERVLPEETMAEVRRASKSLKPDALELHEIRKFGRWVVHDHPFYSELQASLTGLVSSLAGEPLEPGYNFLSLYTKAGKCPLHMDAPSAKWTLDICVNQSEPWDIHFSQVLPWPENAPADAPDWQSRVLSDPGNTFSSHALQPGEAVLFSGSSQWHYRNPMPHPEAHSFCDLLFFHYIPKGTRKLVEPRFWAELFEIPELAGVV